MTIEDRIHTIQELIQQTALLSHRKSSAIKLLAVSKGQTTSAIEQAFQAGLNQFAENYLQEAMLKMQSLQHLPLIWHFIGPIQSNKAQKISQHFSWVHSLSHEKIAVLLNRYRPSNLPKLNVCIQVNLDLEHSKSGILPEELPALALSVNQLPNLTLRGLMAIPKIQLQEDEQYLSFMRLTRLLEQVNRDLGLQMDTLSMGMSEDLVAAIRAGSTIIRIGRAIFGERK